MNSYRIKVFVEQKKEGVVLAKDGRLLVSVNTKRKEGAANERAIQLIAKHFGVSGKCIFITHGHTSSTKTVRIAD